jgi:hypothetical protein
MIDERQTYVRRYTTAPVAYDYGYTRELDPEAGHFLVSAGDPKPIRLVEIEEGREDYQGGRYGSGLYACWTPLEFEERVEARQVVAKR